MAASATRSIPPLDLAGLSIKRVIAHQVFKPRPGGDPIAPKLSNSLTPVGPSVSLILEDRIGESLGKRSWSVPIEFEKIDVGSYFHLASALSTTESDNEFVKHSHSLTLLLGEIQARNRTYPGGILIVIQAEDGHHNPVSLVFKCELVNGLSGSEVDESTILEAVEDLLLTSQSTTHKVCALVKTGKGTAPSDFLAYLFDGDMKKGGELRPAKYFAHGFLGASLAITGRMETTTLYNGVVAVANELEMTPAERLALKSNLDSFVSLPPGSKLNGPQIVVKARDFVTRHVPPGLQDDFEKSLKAKGVSQGPIPLDPIDLESTLKRNRTFLSLGNDLVLSGPTDLLTANVTFNEEDGSMIIKVPMAPTALQ